MILFTSTILISLSILGLGLAFLSASFILNSVQGYSITDPEYKQYYDSTGKPAEFNENLLINSCVLMETPTTLIIDSKGLENTMFEGSSTVSDPCTIIAQHVFVDGYGYTITDTDIDGDRTRITMMK